MNENMMRGSRASSVATQRTARSRTQAASWQHADRVVRAFAEERPFAAVGFALAAGYLIGRAINATR
jgi:ElaB/YqjD/DUF883 family membrane-anchored ribosome-binding protein